MPLPFVFDFKNPDYIDVFNWRLERLSRIRKDPGLLVALKVYYREHPGQFIIDWGTTFAPTNARRGLPSTIPFILFPRQEEWVDWFLERWRKGEPGITMKSRQVGLSWLSVAMAVTICLFNDGIVAGFGSRQLEYVDKLGAPKSLFYKAREFIKLLPPEFRGAWHEDKHSKLKLITFPETNSRLTGEGGNNLGRGDKTSFYFVDESAFLPQPQLVEMSLAETTDCRMDISTPNGPNNPFAQKWLKKSVSQFAFRWQDDPRKDEEWYEKRKRELGDPLIIAQELDLDIFGSLEGGLIEVEWIQSAIDAHIKLGIDITGIPVSGLDIADTGKDKNAHGVRHACLLKKAVEWSGKNSDIFATMVRAATLSEGSSWMLYDADGLGAAGRGDGRIINNDRKKAGNRPIKFIPFHGSGAVIDPDKVPFSGNIFVEERRREPGDRTNLDFFQNAKAQEYFRLRRRCILTHRAVTEGADYRAEDIISLSSKLPNLAEITTELCQPHYLINSSGKVVVDKTPEGAASPNLADLIMILYSKPRKHAGLFDVG